MGHPHQSDDIEVEKYFAVPGQDLVLRWLAPEKDGLAGIDSTMAKCSADAARLMHRRRNANECFGACNKDDNPWQLSGGDIKWYTDWLAVRGVNLFIPHAFYYSICGKRKDEHLVGALRGVEHLLAAAVLADDRHRPACGGRRALPQPRPLPRHRAPAV